MTQNTNGYVAAGIADVYRTKREAMERFDSFPPEIRAVLRDAPYNITLKSGMEQVVKNHRRLRETIRSIARESALKTYGSNYPVELL